MKVRYNIASSLGIIITVLSKEYNKGGSGIGRIQLRRIRGGDSVVGTAGEDLAKYDLVYLKGGAWWKADRDAAASMPAVGICTGSISAGDNNYILLWGIIGNLDWTWVDGPIYASGTAGGLTQAPPTSSGYVQSVGNAYGETFMLFSPAWIKQVDETRSHTEHVQAGKFGRPNTNPPDIVTVDNSLLLEFDVNTDRVFYKWEVSEHYVSGTPLDLFFHWTNDGGTDDNTKNVKIQVDYLPVSDGEVLSGSHANSPRHIDDAYTSASGSVFHTTDAITIPAADFAGKHQIEMKIMFVAADATALTGKPRLNAMMITYTEYVDL